MVPGAAIAPDFFQESKCTLSQITSKSMFQAGTPVIGNRVQPPSLQRSACCRSMPQFTPMQSSPPRGGSASGSRTMHHATSTMSAEIGQPSFVWTPGSVAAVTSGRHSPGAGSALSLRARNFAATTRTLDSSNSSGVSMVQQQARTSSHISLLNDDAVAKLEMERLKETVERINMMQRKQQEDYQTLSSAFQNSLCQQARAVETTDPRSIDASIRSQAQTTATEASFAPSAEVTVRRCENEELTARQGDFERTALQEILTSQQASLKQVLDNTSNLQRSYKDLDERVQIMSSAHDDVNGTAASVANLGKKYADIIDRIGRLEGNLGELQSSTIDTHDNSQQADQQIFEVLMKVKQEVGSLAETSASQEGRIVSVTNSVADLHNDLLGYSQRTALLEKSITQVADRCSAASEEGLSGTMCSPHQAFKVQSQDGEAIRKRLEDLEQSLCQMQNAQTSRDPSDGSPRKDMEAVVLTLAEQLNTKIRDIQTHMDTSMASCAEMLEHQRDQHETLSAKQAETMAELAGMKVLAQSLATNASLLQRDLDDIRSMSRTLGRRLEVLEAQKSGDDNSNIRSSMNRIQELLNTLSSDHDIMKRKVAEVEKGHSGALQLAGSQLDLATNPEAMYSSRNIEPEQLSDPTLLLKLIQHALGTQRFHTARRASCPASLTIPDRSECNEAVNEGNMNIILVKAALAGSDISVYMDAKTCDDDADREVQHKLQVELIRGALGSQVDGTTTKIEPQSTTCAEEDLSAGGFNHELREQLVLLVRQAARR